MNFLAENQAEHSQLKSTSNYKTYWNFITWSSSWLKYLVMGHNTLKVQELSFCTHTTVVKEASNSKHIHTTKMFMMQILGV